mmetsp:Transcript_26405/g.69777  ORF Transcript_26405/g.69777 Transcript_26405/m.69777 type:complete len:363 (+) Transcript_26405:68-1156(+)
MAQTCGISPEELRVRVGEYPAPESPLETAWTFWYDKKTTDRKESDQYMEGLKQLGSFNTIEGFYRHYTYLLRPSELPRDHNVLMFRKGYKPMWEEFPEGGCWIIRIKRKASQNYVNHMWENLLIACIGEAFEMPDVVGCVLSTRLKDDVLSVWNLNNRDTPARFRIGEKLKEVLDLNMTALIQYKDHMQSLQDYSTYRNARNYMFAPSPAATPLMGALRTPLHTNLDTPLQTHGDDPNDQDFEGMLPPAAIDATMLPPAAVDEAEGDEGGGTKLRGSAWSPGQRTLRSPALGSRSPPLNAAAAPWTPETAKLAAQTGKSPALSPAAAPFVPGAAAAASGEAAEGGGEPKPLTWAERAAASKK